MLTSFTLKNFDKHQKTFDLKLAGNDKLPHHVKIYFCLLNKTLIVKNFILHIVNKLAVRFSHLRLLGRGGFLLFQEMSAQFGVLAFTGQCSDAV